jgi:hypothetical protein
MSSLWSISTRFFNFYTCQSIASSKKEIIESILDKQVHRACYRSITERGSLPITRSTSKPRNHLRNSKEKKLQSKESDLSTYFSLFLCVLQFFTFSTYFFYVISIHESSSLFLLYYILSLE